MRTRVTTVALLLVLFSTTPQAQWWRWIRPRVPPIVLTAASCSSIDVQIAINSATAAQTVLVPQGSCTWSSEVAVTGKRLRLQGAGIGQTTITDDTTTAALRVTASAANFVEVSGFTFVKQRANPSGMVQIHGPQGEIAFRFHHNRLFDNGVSGGRGLFVYQVYGLVDHVTFDVIDILGSDQMISVEGSYTGTDGGYTPWTQPLTLGTNKAVYVEDCTFTIASDVEDVIDAYGGARLVIRHNTFNDTTVGFHGTDSGGLRSLISVELYANVFTNNGAMQRRAVTNRGGTALYFNNTYGGTRSWSGFTLVYYVAMIFTTSWGQCDGTALDIGSAVLSSDNSRKTVPYGTGARFLASNPDTVCTGAVAGDCLRAFNGSGSRGYPCRDQPGRGPQGQTLSPIYAWNNGTPLVLVYDGGCALCSGFPAATWIAENRDFYNYVPNGFDGTVGVGRGILSSRPSTCTPLTAYFGTDTNTLYQCATTNTWVTYYVPYSYPHILQS